MICKEYFEPRVVRLVESCVDGMIVRASIRGILHFHILDKDEVFNDFHSLHFPILAEELFDGGLVHIVEPTDIEFSHKDALVDLFSGVRLISEFFLFGLGHLCIDFEDLSVVVDGVVANGEANLVLSFLGLALIVEF